MRLLSLKVCISHNSHVALLQGGDFEQYVTLCVAFMVMSGARTEGVPHPKWAMKVCLFVFKVLVMCVQFHPYFSGGLCVGPPKQTTKETWWLTAAAQYADDKFCWSAGCTWERYEKFEAGDLKDCEASQKALQDFEKWYADSKYGDEDVLPHYKGLPFRKVKGKNDREVVIRDDIEGHEKWAFFATAEVKNKPQ